MAIRYDYGLDFWSYYDSFTSNDHRTGNTEPLFWLFSSLFSKYYQLVAAISCAVMIVDFFWVKKYVPNQWYWFFFLCLMCLPGLSWTMMTALRSDMAIVIISCGLYRFIIKKQDYRLFYLTVLIATLFHNSAIFFLVVPIFSKIIWKVNPLVFFILFIVFSFFTFTGITQIISSSIFSILQQFNMLDADYYSEYSDKYVSNINGAIMRSILLFPAYFICKYSRTVKAEGFRLFYILSIIYLTIHFLSLDFENRFTLYLFIFVFITLSMCLAKMNFLSKVIAVTPVIVLCLYQLWAYYNLMRDEMFGDYSEGNFFIYQTIFDNLPLI